MGFLVTHLGILMMLAGGVVTKLWGIDGQLQIPEGKSGQQVFISERVFEYSGPRDFKKILIPTSASAWREGWLSPVRQEPDSPAQVVGFEPFVRPRAQSGPRGAGGKFIAFRLQSQFFDQEEWLDSVERPQIQMGPALIRFGMQEKMLVPKQEPLHKKDFVGLFIRDADGEAVAKRLDIGLGQREARIGAVKIQVKQVLKRATVADNKIAEGDSGPLNPALEIEILANGKTYRDVIFSRFPSFSLLKENPTRFRFEYVAGGSGESLQNEDAARNLIEFIPSPEQSDKAILRLSKQGKVILEKEVKVGEPTDTPWMGMKVTLVSLTAPETNTAQAEKIETIRPTPKQPNLPPSAILVRVAGEQPPFWLVEGDIKDVQVRGERYQFYYGLNSIRLPFALELLKFTKVDYPGTETAMSFASDVRVVTDQSRHTISMNEPLKRDGYTLYQSSYDLQPGRPALSIFSVNRDPGRWIKYMGGLVLAFGIVTLTITRSRMARRSGKQV
ncbi:MAG: cytochrome c biogenesis protein ResB [Bdellovibrionales bacterium]